MDQTSVLDFLFTAVRFPENRRKAYFFINFVTLTKCKQNINYLSILDCYNKGVKSAKSVLEEKP